FAPDSDQAALPALAHHKSVPLHRSESPLRLVQRPLYERQLDPDNWPIVHDWLNAPSLPDSNLGHFAYSDPLRQPIAHPPPPVCPTKPPSSRGWFRLVQVHSQSLSETADSAPSLHVLWKRHSAKVTSPPDSPAPLVLADHANERSPPSGPDTSWEFRGPRSRCLHWFDG